MGVLPENSDVRIRTHLDQQQYREAFDLVLEHYSTRVVRLSYSILGNLALAEDTAQEAFLRIWRGLPGYRGESSVSTWVFAITRNTCWTALKRGQTHKLESIDEPATWRIAENIRALEPQADRQGSDIRALVLQLPEQYRQVLMLYYMEEKSYEEVARLLDLPLGTVKTHLHRAKKVLAAAILDRRRRGEI